MRAALDAARTALDDEDVAAFSHADIAFHAAVLEAVGNQFVPALLVPAEAALREIRVQTSRDRAASERALVMHSRIYDAIRRRSARTASDAMARHLDETRRHIAAMPQ